MTNDDPISRIEAALEDHVLYLFTDSGNHAFSANDIRTLLNRLKAVEGECERLRAELANAQAQSEAVERDAARYRWLRANRLCEMSDYGDIGLRFDCDFENFNDLDAAVDYAMRKEGTDE